MPTISIIIPAYNAEGTLARALDSVLRQGYADFEAVVVDDGSSDGTAALLDHYAQMDPRIVALHTPNGGVSRARNAALEIARGLYWMFLDADDALEPDAMAELLEPMRDAQTCMTVGADRRVDADDQPIGAESAAPSQEFSAADAAAAMLAGAPFDGTLHAKLLRACDTRFCEDIHIYEDMLFLLEYLRESGQVRYISKLLHRYTMAAGSAMNARVNEKKCTCLDACERIEEITRASFPQALEQAKRFRAMDALMLLQQLAQAPCATRKTAWATRARQEARAALLVADASPRDMGFTRTQKMLYSCLKLGWFPFWAFFRGVYAPLHRLLR